MRTALRLLLIVGLAAAVSCRVGRRPMGVAYVLREGEESRAYYMPILGDEGIRLAKPVKLPFTGPVDQLAFTPAGDELWAWAGAEAGEPALWSLAFSGDRFGEPVRRFDLQDYPAGLASATAPAAGSIVFDALEPETGRWQLFRLEGEVLVRLIAEDADCQSPALSPDGSVVVFSSNRDGAGGAKDDWGLWGYALSTGRVFPVYDTPADEGSPWFAPDGALFFSSFDYAGGEAVGSIWRLGDLAKPKAERLAGPEGLVLFPRPSPDGEWLLLTVYAEPHWTTRLVNLEDLTSRPLAVEGVEVTFACWR